MAALRKLIKKMNPYRKAIDAIAAAYTGPLPAEIEAGLDALAEKVNAATDPAAIERACAVWRAAWIFWIKAAK